MILKTLDNSGKDNFRQDILKDTIQDFYRLSILFKTFLQYF